MKMNVNSVNQDMVIIQQHSHVQFVQKEHILQVVNQNVSLVMNKDIVQQ